MDNNNITLEKQVNLACVSAALSDVLSKKLYGEVLTIVDCSILDPDSKRAVKSLISQSFSRNISRVLIELNKLSVEQNKLGNEGVKK